MSQNLVEKIAQKFAVDLPPGTTVKSGDYIFIQPGHVMTHDNTGAVIPKFQAIGADQPANRRQPVFALDHNVQDKSDKNLAKYAGIEKFASDREIDFYPAGRGIGHQIMCEEGYAWPGTMMVASDSHSNMYGGLGCLGTPIVRTDAAAIWATSKTWWLVPQVARVELNGKLNQGVTGKDAILSLCGHFNNDEVLNHAIEFVGSGVIFLSIDDRLTIANMTTEWGALAGLFPTDSETLYWLRQRTDKIAQRGFARVPSDVDGDGAHPRMNHTRIDRLEENIMIPDADAQYAKRLKIDLSSITPSVSGPGHVKKMRPVAEMAKEKIAINKAYLVSCVNSRVDDLAAAAEVMKGKKVCDSVKFYVAAASDEIQKESEERGDWHAIVKAGAIPLPPGCGPCIGLGTGLLEEDEVGISATNRNFKGRMGAKSAVVYLASPTVVAASALAGYITGLDEHQLVEIKAEIESAEIDVAEKTDPVRIMAKVPTRMDGDLIFCHQDNLNTDGIYPGKYTYIDDFSAEQQAEVVMENYDPEFAGMVEKGDILVGGFNFGTGSSREQAATALKHRGIQLVIAGSFSETYKRNGLNNGFLSLEIPELVNDLRREFGQNELTIKTKLKAEIDFEASTLSVNGKKYRFSPVGLTAQELYLIGGLENWVRDKISK